jgi:hypothetical protein
MDIEELKNRPLTFDMRTVELAIQTSLTQPSANQSTTWDERLIKNGSDLDKKP